MKPIYLDYAATTPVDARVAEKMLAYLTTDGAFGNPASLHAYGKVAREAVAFARLQVADMIGAEASEIIWTSGATEAVNLAIKGAARLYQRKGNHIITLKTEHKAVLDTCQHLEKNGYQLTYLTPEANGLLDLALLQAAIRPETILVSIMHVNNETGVIQAIADIAALTSAKQILLHVDAAQSIGKVSLDVGALPIDLMSLSAHKVYGPKGIGALYVRKRPRVRVEPLIHGGGHEQGMRSGTLATHQIVGMGEAFALAKQTMAQEYARIQALRNRCWEGLQRISACRLTTKAPQVVPHIMNVRFQGMLADAILAKLPALATSTASACQGKGTEGSYVLRAMGFSDEEIKSAIRFSFGRVTTTDEIDQVVAMIQQLFC